MTEVCFFSNAVFEHHQPPIHSHPPTAAKFVYRLDFCGFFFFCSFLFPFVLTLHSDQEMRHREFSADAHQLMSYIEMTVE